jgi:hypothetical protein
LQAQRVRCASLSNKLSELSDDLKALSDGGAQDVDKLRCCVGEVTRLLRQARLAETELQQVRALPRAGHASCCQQACLNRLPGLRSGRAGTASLGPL